MQLFNQDTGILLAANPREALEAEAKRQHTARMIAKFTNEITLQPDCLVGKKPWEMTRSVWESIIAPVSEAYNTTINIGEVAAKVFLNRYGYTHNGYEFSPTGVSSSRHEVQVAYAFLRGENVPLNVANEYPKERWSTTYDLREYEHLPVYVKTPEEVSAAIECWEKAKAYVVATIKDPYPHYQSEAELEHLVACYDKMLSKLAAIRSLQRPPQGSCSPFHHLGSTCKVCGAVG